MHKFVFPFSLFLSACLLFVIQPMVGKVLLPLYGGTPAVWTVCMLFFQVVLLASYGYVWFLSQTRYWRVVHLGVCLLSLLALPLTILPLSGEGIPEYFILKHLLFHLGLPLLVIGSSAPLLQYAYSQTHEKKASDPYFLYSASNVGSLLALLSYPWLIERFSGVTQQFHAWNGIYGLYLVLLLWIFYGVRYQPSVSVLEKPASLGWRRCLAWVFLSFIPCSLMMGVTFYISTDIAATPLFWVLPLALYLLSFIITFARKPLISHAWVVRMALPCLLLPILGFIVGANHFSAWQLITVHLLSFFVLSLLCHGELVIDRPHVSQLATFYFCLALGGVIAGLFNGLIAPRLFVHAYDYPLVLFLAIFSIPLHKKTRVFLSMVLLFLFVFMTWGHPTQTLSQKRNFYGVKQVVSQAGAHVLMSQSTMHGFQMIEDTNPTDGARAYYASVLPVVQGLQVTHQPLRSIIVGLGTGIMACQFRAGDHLNFVEIDSQVIDIAKDTSLFTYLRDCPPDITLISDDGRLAITKLPDASHELLVIDAFTSDAIPVHLLTWEAFRLYQKKITPDGVILVNISNRHLRVLPVLTAAARRLDMILLHKQQAGNNRLGQLASEWALLTMNESLASTLLSQQGWHFVANAESTLWTDDYSDLAPLLVW